MGRLCGLREVVAALVAESRFGRKGLRTVWAKPLQFASAFEAELGISWVVVLALRAFHGFPLR